METATNRIANKFIRQMMARKSGIILDRKLRAPIQRALKSKGLDGNGQIDTPQKGWDLTVGVLKHFGLFPDRPAPRRWLDKYLEDNQRFTIGLEVPSPDGHGMTEINNSVIVFTFYRREYGNFEVMVYLS